MKESEALAVLRKHLELMAIEFMDVEKTEGSKKTLNPIRKIMLLARYMSAEIYIKTLFIDSSSRLVMAEKTKELKKGWSIVTNQTSSALDLLETRKKGILKQVLAETVIGFIAIASIITALRSIR